MLYVMNGTFSLIMLKHSFHIITAFFSNGTLSVLVCILSTNMNFDKARQIQGLPELKPLINKQSTNY